MYLYIKLHSVTLYCLALVQPYSKLIDRMIGPYKYLVKLFRKLINKLFKYVRPNLLKI